MPPKITRVRWSASDIPWGMTFDEATGTFDGTPDEEGEYTVPVKVQTNYGSDTKDVIINVKPSYHWERTDLGTIMYPGIASTGKVSVSSSSKLLVENTIYGKRLLMTAYYTTSYKLYTSSNLLSWIQNATIPGASTAVTDAAYDPSSKYTAVTLTTSTGGLYYYKVHTGSSSDYLITSYYPSALGSSYLVVTTAVCYSDTLKSLLYVTSNGKAFLVTNSSVVDKNGVTTSIKSVPVGCAAWSPEAQVFCIAGTNGTAISPNGQEWTTNTSSSAHKDFVELYYREDLGKFIARSSSEKIFYISDDGITWTQFNSTPFPLETVARVAYCNEYDIYCAIGGKSKYAYLSKDLVNWKETTVSDTDITMNDVVYFPGSSNQTKKFCLIPLSGTNYYTLDATNLDL